ncbi:MAG: ribonuclease E/G [Eubacterium sp.]|nr:ribonuclease E/G [Eubacterium sp.]
METTLKRVLITRIEGRIVSAYMIGEKIYDVIIGGVNEDELQIGDVYVGRVQNVVENIGAAFVEVRPGVMGYLKLERSQMKTVKAGQEQIVQVRKNAKGSKNAVLSTEIEMLGRYAVLQEQKENRVLVSKKIRDEETIRRLTQLGESIIDEADEMTTNVDMGEHTAPTITIRTNAAEADDDVIRGEIRTLYDTWCELHRHGSQRTGFSRLYRELPVYVRMINRYRNGEIDRVITDQEDVLDVLKSLPLEPEVEAYEDTSYPLEARYAIRTTLDKALDRHVWLKSGADLYIDRTEAMTVIDVNTAKAIEGKRASESTFFKINLEAAEEIARQIRLRNLSGIILVDFIDMKDKGHVDALIDTLRWCLKTDPVRAMYVDMTKLGIVEITRSKRYMDLYDAWGEELRKKCEIS